MEYTIENDVLRVVVASTGAELQSIVYKATGEELLWQGDPDIWPRRAPILFPHCGALAGDVMVARGREYASGRHGFARDMEFDCVLCEDTAMELCLVSQEATRWRFPYEFALKVRYELAERRLLQTVAVQNAPVDEMEGYDAFDTELPFNLGFHPGFCLPMSPGKTTGDYEVVFEGPESPVVLKTTPDGLMSGERVLFFQNGESIPLRDDLFENDSICFAELHSKSMTLRQKDDASKYVKVDIAEFPYVLLWGPPRGPLPFVCIEPWHGLPDPVAGHGEFGQKDGIQKLRAGERFTTTLAMEFGR